MNYEDKIKEIESIIEKLNEGKVPMAEAVKNFERASELTKECYKELNELKGKVSIIKEELGMLIEEDIDEWKFQNYLENDLKKLQQE